MIITILFSKCTVKIKTDERKGLGTIATEWSKKWKLKKNNGELKVDIFR